MLGSIKMTLGWKCKYFWISEYSDQIVPILLQRKICIEIISETKRNPVISPRTQKFAQPLDISWNFNNDEHRLTPDPLWLQCHVYLIGGETTIS